MMKHQWRGAILILLTGGIIIVFLFTKNRKDTIEDIEKRVGLDFSEYMTVVDFKAFTEDGERHGELKLMLNENVEEVKLELEEKFGKNLIDVGYSPQYYDYNLWSEVQNGKIVALYQKMLSGKRAKTLIIDFFVVDDLVENYYLYIFY